MTKIEYFALSGGLDYASSVYAIEPGALVDCLNYEQIFGRVGYKRIDGYERFDGSPQPHKAEYWKLRFRDGSSQINEGDPINDGDDGVATVIDVIVESGSWSEGSAAGTLILDFVAGDFSDGDQIRVGTTQRAVADGSLYKGVHTDSDYGTHIAKSSERRRSLISKVPGSGPVRGIAVFKGDVYAIRDAEDGLSATLWRSSPSGWVQIHAGLHAGSRWRFLIGNFKGDTTDMSLFGVNGRSRLLKFNGTSVEFAPPIFGTESLSNTSVAVGTGSKTFTLTTTARSYTNGMAVVISSTANAANRMVGVVTSYTPSSNQLVVNVTEAYGSGTFNAWEICRADFSDRPYELAAYKDHMWLAYANGQLQTSNLGEPMQYTTSAALFGIGDTITGLVSLKGDIMAVFCRSKIDFIKGSSILDWERVVYASNTGARSFSVQENAGNAIFIDDKGISTLQATQAFGEFESSIFSRNVKPYLDAVVDRAVGSRMVKSKYQYRVYIDDGSVLTCTILSPNAVLKPSDVAFTRQKLFHVPCCFAHGEIEEGEVAYLFGTTDGYVMREDVGTSFDGEPITSAILLPFNTSRMPSNRKRYHKLVFEMSTDRPVSLSFKQLFDFDDGQQRPSVNMPASALGSGGQLDKSSFDMFEWSKPIFSNSEVNVSGVGRNMAILVSHVSGTDKPFFIHGVLLHFSPLGLAR